MPVTLLYHAAPGAALRVTCSEAAQVRLQSDTRFARRVVPEDSAAPLTSAEFDLSPWLERAPQLPNAFVRVTVEDARGRYAVTRAYRLEELGQE